MEVYYNSFKSCRQPNVWNNKSFAIIFTKAAKFHVQNVFAVLCKCLVYVCCGYEKCSLNLSCYMKG